LIERISFKKNCTYQFRGVKTSDTFLKSPGLAQTKKQITTTAKIHDKKHIRLGLKRPMKRYDKGVVSRGQHGPFRFYISFDDVCFV